MVANPASLNQPASVKLLINGEFVESRSSQWRDIVNPATQQVLARVPFATAEEVAAAVASARTAFQTWRKTPIGARARSTAPGQRAAFGSMRISAPGSTSSGIART